MDAHTHFHLLDRAGETHPLLAGQIELEGSQSLRLDWDPGGRGEDTVIMPTGKSPLG
ncbi:hypothetical protein ACIGZJ_32150 [Kitasatospora sp. NPDC052868]|uniref:hypothetical protein n=1 Tax=Kitasatospora sp. NPDC052868 TaxID=3364060 RepID=UPI0037C9369A